MNKKIILCDMDGVIVDFRKGILDINPNLTMHDDNHDKEETIVDSIVYNNTQFFQNLKPIEHSIESVKELMKYYNVYFCSTPMEIVPHSFTGKKEWLNTHFGDKAFKNLILTHRKDLCIGDYLIDDRIKNGAGEFTGEHIHFASNKFPDWESVLKYLLNY
jgi:5'(3')-deoxyribonucleotidase